MSRYDVRQDSLLLKLPRADDGLPCAGNVIIHRRLGKGGMGTVYLGFDRNLAAEVAVKVLPFGFAEESSAVERFFREARSTFKLDHPNIVRVLTVDQEGDTYYLVMEFVDGESADQRVKREGPLPERDALEIAVGAGEALAAAHAKGILHRDVKPANILIRYEDGRVKLADLGLAKALGGEGGETTGLTATGAMLGTPAYMSPEQAEDASRVDERTDIYCLGATLYALLSGKAPFEETQLLKLLMKVTKEEPRDLRSLRWEVSEETAGAVRKLMAKSPLDRLQWMIEAVNLLRGCRDASPAEGARGLARPEMAGSRKVKVSVEEATPTPVAPRTLDDVTPSQVRRESEKAEAAAPPAAPRPFAVRMSGGKKVALALAVLVALVLAGVGTAYLYSKKIAADALTAQRETEARAEAKRAAAYEKWMDNAFELKLAGKLKEAGETYAKAAEYAPQGSLEATKFAADCLWKSYYTQALQAEVNRDLEGVIGIYTEALDKIKDRAKRAVIVEEKQRVEAKIQEQAREAEREAEAEKLSLQGIAACRTRNFEEAIEKLSLAIGMYPNNPYFYAQRAWTYGLSGDHYGAVADYNKAIEINPMIAAAYSDRAYQYYKLGTYDRAIRDYERAIRLDPDNASNYFGLGTVYHRLRDHRKAIADYTRAIELGETSAHGGRGSCYARIGDHRKAIADYTRAIELGETSASVYLRRGLTYSRIGHHREAIADYSRAIELGETSADVYLFRGSEYYAVGSYEKAIEDFNVAIRLKPGDADAYQARGLARGKLRDYEGAKSDFKRAAALDPAKYGKR